MERVPFAAVAAAIAILGLAACSRDEVRPAAPGSSSAPPPGYAGSSSCRECHEKFYQLWSTSMHGLAMQPYGAEFAKTRLSPQSQPVTIGEFTYRADIAGPSGAIVETGPKGETRYPIEHALGGKNVFYFLTPFPNGRLQTLPLAYDVGTKQWFDAAESGIRHFPGARPSEAVHWTDTQYTFNTSCYNCHVSQLSTNYDAASDSYHTTWTEPGINCETCHGLSRKHNEIARATPKGQPLPELGLISTKTMTREQRNDLCVSCHAKGSPLTATYRPGERFFDHFDLATLEDADYYPDGRDLGENYTATSWRMSPCAQSGQLDCLHCHTSSGRYRFKDPAKANDSCLPCHEERVKNAPAHTHHPEGSPGNRCTACHMPMTAFARMNRSDHSMLPPAPAATLAYKSPNACNLCHPDKDAAWADRLVREWRPRDYQAPLLERAALVEAARKRDWSRLPAMLAYIRSKDRDEIFAASLIRLLASCPDERVAPALLVAAKDPSPLVRSAAIDGLATRPSPQALQALLDATGDAYRVVRVRAAAGLAGFPMDRLPPQLHTQLERADVEYVDFITTRPDQWSSHYNLGNYQMSRGETAKALASFEAALKREPRAVLPMVNASIAYARTGEVDKAEQMLEKALAVAPDSAAAQFNMGLVKAEKKDTKQAEIHLRKAVALDPGMAQAAFNLCIVIAPDRIDEAITWCRKAAELLPQEPRYASTLAFYLNQKGDQAGAVAVLTRLIGAHPEHLDAYTLLGSIYEGQGKRSKAEGVYRKALAAEGMAGQDKVAVAARLSALRGGGAPTR